MRRILHFLIMLLSVQTYSQAVRQKTAPNKSDVSISRVTKSGNYTWSQSDNCHVSAGVYDANGMLVRTLFSNVFYSAGKHTEKWDGLFDDRSSAPASNYNIKVLTSNVSCIWEGTYIENTCDSITGANHARSYNSPTSVCVVGDTSYWSLLYGEAFAPQFYRSVRHPESGVKYFGFANGTYVNNFNCTDGKTVYNSIVSDRDQKWFIWAVDVSDHAVHSFSSAIKVVTGSSGSWSAVDTSVGSPGAISGIAVEKTGKYLIAIRNRRNQVHVIDKRTGELVQTITIKAPSRIAITADNKVWLQHDGSTLEKYTVNSDGTLTSTGLTITPSYYVGAITVSTSNTTLAIADMDNCLLKGYSNVDGSLLWTRGTQDGYKYNATVTNTKWMWTDSGGYNNTFIQYLPDNSYYLEDGENRRTLRFDSASNYMSSIFLRQSSYITSVDKADSSRVFSDFREYHIDYNKSLGSANGSWTLVNNWGYNFSTAIYDHGSSGIRSIVTEPNGHSYTVLQSKSTIPFYNYVCELVSGGTLRNTSVHVNVNGYFERDGSFVSPGYVRYGSASPFVVKRLHITGYDSVFNPTFDAGSTIASIVDAHIGAYKTAVAGNKVVGYDISAAANHNDNKDYHLEFIDTLTNTLIAKGLRGSVRAYSGPFPDGGYFDNGNTVNVGTNGGGGFVTSYGNIVEANYHGEFYKQAQTNKHFLYDANTGLEITQFGTVSDDYRGQVVPAGVEGNIIKGDLVKAKGNLYLYHNGESFGLHRWLISNPSSISVINATYPSGSSFSDTLAGIDLMPTGVNRYDTMPVNSGAWHMSTSYYTDVHTQMRVRLGYNSYDVFKEPDMQIWYSSPDRTDSVYRDLGNNNATTWKITGEMYRTPSYIEQSHNYEGEEMDVVDSNGKRISRLWVRQSPYSLMGNSTVIEAALPYPNRTVESNYYQPFEISCSGSTLTFKYGANAPVTTTITQDAGAIINNPYRLKFLFWTHLPSPRGSQSPYIFRNLKFLSQ